MCLTTGYSSDLFYPRSASLTSARRSPSRLRLARSVCSAINLGCRKPESLALWHVLVRHTTSRVILQCFRCYNIFQPYGVELGGVGHFRNALWGGSIETGILSWGWTWEGWEGGMIGVTCYLEVS